MKSTFCFIIGPGCCSLPLRVSAVPLLWKLWYVALLILSLRTCVDPTNLIHYKIFTYTFSQARLKLLYLVIFFVCNYKLINLVSLVQLSNLGVFIAKMFWWTNYTCSRALYSVGWLIAFLPFSINFVCPHYVNKSLGFF